MVRAVVVAGTFLAAAAVLAGFAPDSLRAQLALITSGLAVLVAIAALARGLRAGPGIVRQQSKWVVWGATVCAVGCVGCLLLARPDFDGIAMLLVAFGILVLAGACMVAIRRRWLHEVDVVISRSLVYAALAGYVVAVSLCSLIVAGRTFGVGGDSSMVVAVIATIGIAAGFRPLRGRVEAVVERAVYGRTATPHRVLSEFSRRIAANGEDPIAVVAKSLVEGTGAERAEIWLDNGGSRIKAAEWPTTPSAVTPQESRFPVSHAGTTLGVLVLAAPPGGRLVAEDRDLAEQVASGMGLALQNGMLASTLEQRVVQLRASRRRLIAVRDETRRRLERDLHDGAQQQLVALRVKLGLARVMADQDGVAETGASIDELATLAESAIDALRDLARGVYPPLLEAEGLAASIAAEARRVPFATALRVGGLGRYDRDVEGTVYLCVVEALRQVAEIGTCEKAVVTVRENDARLLFGVVIEGAAGDTTWPRNAGALPPRLAALADRVDTMSGELVIGAAPDAPGAVLSGVIPTGKGAAA
jgi:signal transduction histidine kinase